MGERLLTLFFALLRRKTETDNAVGPLSAFMPGD
jgi:hypothetical protein